MKRVSAVVTVVAILSIVVVLAILRGVPLSVRAKTGNSELHLQTYSPVEPA